MTDTDLAAGMSEDVDLIEEARAEYLERVAEIQALDSPEFEDAAADLLAWVDEVNADLNEPAQEILGEGLAVNAESLGMLRLSRGLPG